MEDFLLSSFGLSLAINMILFLIAYFFQTDKLTDLSYSLCFLAINTYNFIFSDFEVTDMIVFAIISLWALRLGSYLLFRINTIGRDARFDGIREKLISFFGFWIVQSISVFILCIPIIILYAYDGYNINSVFILGVVISLMGLIIESIADQQKFNFKIKNPNQFMQVGLWKKLRHPNYTGEILFWIGIFICVVPVMSSSYWVPIQSPTWISFLLIEFSGIPPLEKVWNEKYGDSKAYKDYVKNSDRIIPWVY